jgi:hypothetical protein
MESHRMGDWMQTFTQRKFYPLDPRPDDVCIEDIAHALANICRYGGHVKHHYSVAQHSIYVAAIVGKADPAHALSALLHDAAEAYIGDMVRPLKKSMATFRDAEAGIMQAICKRFKLPLVESELLHDVDYRICFSEADALLHGGTELWSWKVEGAHRGISESEWPKEYLEDRQHEFPWWDPTTAKARFLETFARLAYPFAAQEKRQP